MSLHTLWKFSRPHTIIGSTVSIVVLFLLQGGSIVDQYLILLTTLVSALGCNVCITGLNQVIDIELDKINKPELPIASGELSMSTAKKIVIISGIIAVGAAALAAFAFTFVIFGAILIWTGVGLFKHWDEDPSPGDNKLVKVMRKRIAMVDEFHGTKLFIRQNGKRYATPMFMVMVAIASTDLLFALDSIPATFGVTSETFLVFSANAFALLGLRALYFLVKGLLDRLVYLSLGLSIILMFIGVKLIMTYLHEEFTSIPKIPTSVSLAVIGMILLVATVASLVKTKSDPSAKAHAGRITGSHDDEERNS